MKISQRVTDWCVYIMNLSCAFALCCIVAVDIHEAMKARASGDRTREVGYWCAAAFQGIMAALFPIIILRCAISADIAAMVAARKKMADEHRALMKERA